MKANNYTISKNSDLNHVAEQNSEEVPFSFEELFFSRTDSRGIVLAGNNVFRRISLYEWTELLNKPHNIIRHSDMPKGVFSLFWDFLKKGKPIGAYVKNRAKDGRYYWVFAIATPIDEGFLSVRLKPSSDIFPIVQNVYKSLLAFERDNKPSPQESADHLLGELNALGFASYEQFMSLALAKEIAARDTVLGIEKNKFIECFEGITQQAQDLISETTKIFSSYEENKYVPVNLQVQSFQLGDQGKTIGVISGNYNIVSTEIRNEIDRFKQSATDVFNQIYEGQFLLCTSRIQGEVIEFFTKESGDPEAQKKEMEYLQNQQIEYEQKAIQGLATIVTNIDRFKEDCHRMKMCSSSLEVIRIMGKVDAARLDTTQSGLHELINELKLFQTSIAGSLQKIEHCNNGMQYDTKKIIAALKSA